MHALLTLLLVALIGASSAFSGSYSSSANLYGPTVGEVGYGTKVSDNFLTKIDPALPLFRSQIPALSVVGDLVYVVGANTVALSRADAEATARIDGYVYEKISSTEARVRTAGRVGGYTGLVAGTRYYLSASASGKVTDVAPIAPDLVVEAGVALDSTTLVLYSRPNPTVESGDLQTAYDRGSSAQSIQVDAGGSISLEDSSGNPIVVVGDDGFMWEPRSSPRMTVATDPGHVWFTNATPDLGLLQWSPYFWNGTEWSLMFSTPGSVVAAANINVGGVGVYNGKIVDTLQFRGINIGSSKLSINYDVANKEIDLDLGFVYLNDLFDVNADPLLPGDVLSWNGSSWTTDAAPIETASNTNVGGVGVFSSKVGTDLRFRGVNAASSKITVALDAPNREIDIDLGTVNIDDLADVASAPLLTGDRLSWSGTQWTTRAAPIDTASNYGVGGVGVYNSKNVTDLRFRNINAASSKITVALDAPNREVDVDLGTVTLDDLSNVAVPSPSTNDILAFNGTNWVNTLPTSGGIVNAAWASYVGTLTLTSIGVWTNTGLSVAGLPAGTYLLTFDANVYKGSPANPGNCECQFWNSVSSYLPYSKYVSVQTNGAYVTISNDHVGSYTGSQFTVDCRAVTQICYMNNLQMAVVRLY